MNEQELCYLAESYDLYRDNPILRRTYYNRLVAGVKENINTVERALEYLRCPDYSPAETIGNIIYCIELAVANDIIKNALQNKKE